jgi:hypothetical protein
MRQFIRAGIYAAKKPGVSSGATSANLSATGTLSASGVVTYPGSSTPTNHAITLTGAGLADSVGVNVHTPYLDTMYANRDLMLSSLTDLGIKHLRDELRSGPGSYYPAFNQSLLDAGIQYQMILGRPDGANSMYNSSQYAAAISLLKTNNWAGYVESLEGPNEWDINGGGTWAADLRAFMAAYYPAIRGDSYFNGIPVEGPSMAHPGGYTTYGADSNSDGGNLHSYAGEEMPEATYLDTWISGGRLVAGTGKPLYTTEWGWQQAQSTSWFVDEDTQADYLVRGLIWNANKGIVRSWIYELFDWKPDAQPSSNTQMHWGLVATTGSGTTPSAWVSRQKPAYAAVKNLIGRLADTATGTAPTSYSYGTSTTGTDVTILPIGRKDGSIDLAIWRATPVWSTTTNSRITLTPKSVTVTLPTAKNITLYRPGTGTLSTIASSASTFSVNADGQMSLVRIA